VVRADPGQIEQVLMNLVVNARDAMPEGGKLTIETSNAEIDDEYAANHVGIQPGPYVRLTVSDTGFGMDERTQARVFEPFFTTKAKGKGTGLGLSTVYGIVKQSAGNVSVYSEPGLGTSFKIYLPRELSAKPVPIGEAKRSSKPRWGTETVLVVDDEEGMRRLAIRALTESGYTVLSAANGDEAIRVCEERDGEIHLLLTDVVMPNMSGRVLSQKISILRPAIKILYMSGYTDEAIVHHGVLDPGTRFLGKPFTAADLAQKVREILDNSAADGRTVGQAAEGIEDIVPDKRNIDPESLRSLPPGFLGKMLKAVAAARYDEILALIETIGVSSPDVAETFRRMANLFDYEGLREILDQKKDG
jgi:two-component system cell cycle sensor histidine kinase/response regulator CckA